MTTKEIPEMPDRIRLVGEVPVQECIQTVFGHLVELAAPVMEHYHSDLYWDAKWLDNNLEVCLRGLDEVSFFFGVDQYGTSIGTDETLVAIRCQSPDSWLYQLTLECEGARIREETWEKPAERVGTWYLSIREMERRVSK